MNAHKLLKTKGGITENKFTVEKQVEKKISYLAANTILEKTVKIRL